MIERGDGQILGGLVMGSWGLGGDFGAGELGWEGFCGWIWSCGLLFGDGGLEVCVCCDDVWGFVLVGIRDEVYIYVVWDERMLPVVMQVGSKLGGSHG